MAYTAQPAAGEGVAAQTRYTLDASGSRLHTHWIQAYTVD